MKRSLTVATALLLCASSAAQAQDQDKKDKNRDRPAAAQSSQPASRPQPAAKPDRPAFQPQQRPAPQPSFQQQRPAPQPSFQPRTERPAVQPFNQQTIQPAPRIDRSARPDQQPRPDRPDKAARPDKPDRPDRPDRPDKSARPDASPAFQADKPRPDKPLRPIDRSRPVQPPRMTRPVIAEPAARVKPAKGSLPTRPDRARRPQKPASPAAIMRTRAIHQALQADRRRTFHFRGRTIVSFKARPYRYPGNWKYRAWRRHQRFPVELFLTSWFINDFLNYGLYGPPPGYRWVRYGPDAVLVNSSSYDIADTAYGAFDDGSSYGGGYNDADLPPIDPDLPQEFADGSLDLAAGADQSDACAFFYGDRQTQEDIDAAWAAQDWNGLARTVIWAGCGNDVSYYLLGLSAEGLALPDAAANYYGRAIDMADGDQDSTFKCSISGPDTCRGLEIGAEASDGLDRIYGPPPAQ